MAKQKKKNPEALSEKEKEEIEKRRNKLFGEFYEYYTKGKTEEEILDKELLMIDPDKWVKKALKEGRLLVD